MRCQLNQEMIRPTNSEKQLFDNDVDNMELCFKLQFSTCSFFVVQGLSALDPAGHFRAFSRRLPGTDSQGLGIVLYLTRKERLGLKKTLTCEIDLEFFYVSSILVDGLAGVLSILV